MLDTIQTHYGYTVEVYRPQAEAVEGYVAQYGLNGFYESVEARKECCRVRKVEPLGSALQANVHGLPANAVRNRVRAMNLLFKSTTPRMA